MDMTSVESRPLRSNGSSQYIYIYILCLGVGAILQNLHYLDYREFSRSRGSVVGIATAADWTTEGLEFEYR
jgi:hypothetical protein